MSMGFQNIYSIKIYNYNMLVETKVIYGLCVVSEEIKMPIYVI